MRYATVMLGCAVAVGGAWAVGAADEVQVVRPSPPPPDASPKIGLVDGKGPSKGDSANAAGLKGIRAIATRPGEATVIVGGAQRVLRVGEAIGSDTVKSIDAGRIVLARSAAPEEGGEATVVITFDAQGRGRVRVFSVHDASARVPPAVR
jgi:hypothetical protein